MAGIALVLPAHIAASAAGSSGIFHQIRLPASTAPRISAGSVKRQVGWTSSNWSGYAVTNGAPYTSATAQWVVPSVAATRGASYSSNWVGIDGFNNNNLIQTGTESDYYNGSAHYDAWWEILPAAETVIPSLAISPGNVMSATITKGSGTSWTITIKDNSTGQSFTTTQSYSGPGSSAEWIEEAPSIGGRVATLARYSSPDTFDPGTANGKAPGLTAADSGAMVQHRAQVSTPSNPDSEGDGFNMAYGSAAPSAPAS
jgi:hypothetical protein